VTEPGKAVVEVIEQLLQEAENLKQVGREFKDQAAGTLTIATTHTQARYSLPRWWARSNGAIRKCISRSSRAARRSSPRW